MEPSEPSPLTRTLDLGGTTWTLHRLDTGEQFPATVPGCNFTDLRRAGAIPDPFASRNEADLHWVDDTDWAYTRDFELDPTWLREARLELVCEGLDTLATVFLNGLPVGRADNMHRVWRFDLRGAARPGSNRLRLVFDNPTSYALEKARAWEHRIDDGSAFLGSLVRKQHSSFSWDWAPCLAPSGIHLPIRIEAWSGPRLDRLRIGQDHGIEGMVTVTAEAELAGEAGPISLDWILSLRGEEVARGAGLRVALGVHRPELWWPRGHGEQPLYDLETTLYHRGQRQEVRRWRLGLRTISVEQPEDAHGRAFFFRVNGRDIYAKGANWIPAHQFASEVTPERYRDLLQSAAAAHMNMIRVWGGGLYEQETFYDLCDELGLLVWHDFMFSCSLYPDAPEFLDNVRAEAVHQVRRLAHRACLALWCGNNELEHFVEHINRTPRRRAAFEQLFFRTLPEIVAESAPQTFYWPGSPHNPKGWDQGPSVEDGGDGHHYWTGWDKPGLPEGGTDKLFRFCSEFGIQGLPSMRLIESFTQPAERNYFHPTIQAHEKSPGMLNHMLRDLSRIYPLAADLEGIAHLTQLLQARHLRAAIDHHRRHQPRCMGSLYWQLNDTWPGIAWSTIEFGGRWKLAHHAVKAAFAPRALGARLHRNEIQGMHGRITTEYLEADAELFNDLPGEFRGRLVSSLRRLDGTVLQAASVAVVSAGPESRVLHRVPLAAATRAEAPESLAVVFRLEDAAGALLDERTLLLAEPRSLSLRRPRVQLSLVQVGDAWCVDLATDALALGVCLEAADAAWRFGDNGFTLWPDAPRRVWLTLPGGVLPQPGQITCRTLQDG